MLVHLARPDLILIDGGLGQLAAAMEGLKQVGHRDLAIIGLAKARGEKELSIPDFMRFVKERAAKLNISQAELARRINKDPQHIELIENGKVSPNVYTLYIVAMGLDVPLAELMKV